MTDNIKKELEQLKAENKRLEKLLNCLKGCQICNRGNKDKCSSDCMNSCLNNNYKYFEFPIVD